VKQALTVKPLMMKQPKAVRTAKGKQLKVACLEKVKQALTVKPPMMKQSNVVRVANSGGHLLFVDQGAAAHAALTAPPSAPKQD